MVITVAGPIGAGKTTLSELLAKALGTKVFYEPVDNNPILDKFYSDPKKWAFSLQIYFLNKRFQMIKEALYDNNNILDRSIYEDKLFTKINHRQGNINEIDMNLYNDLFNNMMQELKGLPKKSPDLLIFIYPPFDQVLAQIKKRGRNYEQIDNNPELLEYYELLYAEYARWFNEYHESNKVMINSFDIHNMIGTFHIISDAYVNHLWNQDIYLDDTVYKLLEMNTLKHEALIETTHDIYIKETNKIIQRRDRRYIDTFELMKTMTLGEE